MHAAKSATWASGVLLLSFLLSHVAGAAGLTWLAPLAFLPFLPMFLVVLVLMGGPHAASDDPLLMVYTGLLAFAVWWAVFYMLSTRLRATQEATGDPP